MICVLGSCHDVTFAPEFTKCIPVIYYKTDFCLHKKL